MRSLVLLSAALLASVNVLASVQTYEEKVTCTSESGTVEVVLEKLGYDQDGELFQGTITKNGDVVRRTEMRRAAVSNYFGVYSKGWNFDSYRSPLQAFIVDNGEYLSLAHRLGDSNLSVICDKELPPRSWDR